MRKPPSLWPGSIPWIIDLRAKKTISVTPFSFGFLVSNVQVEKVYCLLLFLLYLKDFLDLISLSGPF